MLRFTLVLAGVIACVMGMLNVLRIGQARSMVKRNRSLATVTQAVQLSPHDPDVYLARAAILAKGGEVGLAIDDLRQAIALRPRDHKSWHELARLLAEGGDDNIALEALSKAGALAPFNFSVRWDTGTLLQKLGRHEEAFREFRAATLTLPALFPDVIENAWETYDGNCDAIQRAVDPRTTEEQLALARFFINKDRSAEALGVVRMISNLSGVERRHIVGDFLRAKLFVEAHEVWAKGRAESLSHPALGTIDNGGFEDKRLTHETGFTWVVEDEIIGVNVSLDDESAHSGMSSLLLNWKDTPDPAKKIISQLVLVESNTRYKLDFVARVQDLITAGAPVVTIVDVSKTENKKLAQSSVLPLGNSDWQNLSIEFVTGSSTRAILIALQRQNCNEQPCPIFGSLWLDDFRLTRNLEVAG